MAEERFLYMYPCDRIGHFSIPLHLTEERWREIKTMDAFTQKRAIQIIRFVWDKCNKYGAHFKPGIFKRYGMQILVELTPYALKVLSFFDQLRATDDEEPDPDGGNLMPVPKRNRDQKVSSHVNFYNERTTASSETLVVGLMPPPQNFAPSIRMLRFSEVRELPLVAVYSYLHTNLNKLGCVFQGLFVGFIALIDTYGTPEIPCGKSQRRSSLASPCP